MPIKTPKDDAYGEVEAQKRFEAALKGALKTPHKPRKPEAKQKTVNPEGLRPKESRS